ncbi:hypothetical protein [Mesorhizobium loti]|uniref:hypothetical protein n=1 Tax=Rhizobium loti TaxID=381 RepID=UPI00147366AC|nr:hypothetical protein [Mesorhizobium loti]
MVGAGVPYSGIDQHAAVDRISDGEKSGLGREHQVDRDEAATEKALAEEVPTEP